MMNNRSDKYTFYRNVCIVMIWAITIYSAIIQNVFFHIPYGIPLLGGAILLFYGLANSDKPFKFRDITTEEDIKQLWFMAYILIAGLLFAPDRNSHVSQWFTCLEYLFIQIVIASITKKTGTDTFHTLLMANSLLLIIVFLRKPVNYLGTGRYSISEKVNPNGLGLGFVAGIWGVLYRQLNKRQPLILSGIIVGLLGYCILLTGSRKSLIGAGLTVFLWLLFCFFPSIRGKGIWNEIFSLSVMLILIIIIAREFLVSYSDTTIASRMDNLLYEATEGKRSDMYREGYELWKRNPIFGIGFQGFKYYFGKYSHATIVEIPVSGGIIGTLLYFCIYIVSIKRLIFAYRKTKGKQDLSSEHIKIKMLIILWIVMVFFTICVIHPYQFDSCINFGIIFGGTAYVESRLALQQKKTETKKTGSKYIRA